MPDDRFAGARPVARFKDLCLDSADPQALAQFWGAVLGQPSQVRENGVAVIEPPVDGDPARRMWVGPVPEPRTGKTRVHLDLRMPVADPGPLVQSGARVVREPTDTEAWWVLADPEGNEFCAFGPAAHHQVSTPEPFELVVDSSDPLGQARWWAGILGGQVRQREGAAFAYIERPNGFPWMFWVFNPVPEPKTVKNRWHWDITLTGADPQPLIDAGATLVRSPDEQIRWWVLADPEGNEFCAFAP